MTTLALDTSAAVPFVQASHVAHRWVRDHVGDRGARLTGHSLAETYAVLTRLPGDARVAPADVVTLLAANFAKPALLAPKTAASIAELLARAGVAGGATYDALVALAARDAKLPLATRDRRAASTYAALGVTFELIHDG